MKPVDYSTDLIREISDRTACWISMLGVNGVGEAKALSGLKVLFTYQSGVFVMGVAQAISLFSTPSHLKDPQVMAAAVAQASLTHEERAREFPRNLKAALRAVAAVTGSVPRLRMGTPEQRKLLGEILVLASVSLVWDCQTSLQSPAGSVDSSIHRQLVGLQAGVNRLVFLTRVDGLFSGILTQWALEARQVSMIRKKRRGLRRHMSMVAAAAAETMTLSGLNVLSSLSVKRKRVEAAAL